jgi:hypothetical protein
MRYMRGWFVWAVYRKRVGGFEGQDREIARKSSENTDKKHKLERNTHASAKVRMLLLIFAPCTPSASVPRLLTAVDDPATPSNSLAFSASSLFTNKLSVQCPFLIAAAKQGKKKRCDSGEDGTNGEESSSMDKKEKKEEKEKGKNKGKINKKDTNRNSWNTFCILPTAKILLLMSCLLATRSSVMPAASASSLSPSETTSSS